jgi:hypothetical protein
MLMALEMEDRLARECGHPALPKVAEEKEITDGLTPA